MITYTQLAALPAASGPVVATIGNFDGVHLGHQGVIAEVISRARFLGGHSLAVTFDPHPARVLHPDQPHPLITPLPQKLALLAATGLDATLVLPFTDELRHMHPREFATRILVDALHITEIHEGENFRFGYHAEAGVHGLEALGRELGFSVVVYAPRIVRGAPVSSSRIRKLLAAGDVSHARALLGRSFTVNSTPAPGRGYGSRYAVPTINLAPYPELLPANGVYITTLTIGSGPETANPALQHRPSEGPASRYPEAFEELASRYPEAFEEPASRYPEAFEGPASRYPEAFEEPASRYPEAFDGLASRYPEDSSSGLSGPQKSGGLQPLGQTFDAVTNIGVRPTFGADSFAVESHLLNFHPLALSESTPLRLTFLRRFRAEQRFPTPEALRDQIARDVTHARRFFSLCHRLTG